MQNYLRQLSTIINAEPPATNSIYERFPDSLKKRDYQCSQMVLKKKLINFLNTKLTRSVIHCCRQEETMIDILYLLLVVLFFAASYALIKGLEKL
jgi:hypothetical protein